MLFINLQICFTASKVIVITSRSLHTILHISSLQNTLPDKHNLPSIAFSQSLHPVEPKVNVTNIETVSAWVFEKCKPLAAGLTIFLVFINELIELNMGFIYQTLLT